MLHGGADTAMLHNVTSHSLLVLHSAAAVRDADGVRASPGAIAVLGDSILASGLHADVQASLPRPADRVVEHGEALLLPAFVNAHAHLDLAAIGRFSLRGSFLDWVSDVIAKRPADPLAIHAAVTHGLEESVAAGVGWIGDIAGSDAAVLARLHAPPSSQVDGISWLECFGLGERAVTSVADTKARLESLSANVHANGRVQVGLEPHAPYSAAPELYALAAAHGIASSHLAETREELEFTNTARGPFADLLLRLGKWDDSIMPLRQSPIAALSTSLRHGSWVIAHGNYLDDDDLAILATLPHVALAYCPVASEYFGHAGHRYRELLARGVNVCLGTDSVICQPIDEPQPHGILAQVRRLWRRDRFDPDRLLAMATLHGARALRAPPLAATLMPGAPARLCKVAITARQSIDPWLAVLESDAPMQPVAG